MPEAKKRIAIASVLKPLDDTRMTEKIASSLADDYDVHVIGFPSPLPEDSRMTYHTFRAFSRLSFSRWFASFRILKILLQLRPSVLIITTHELLLSAFALKIFLQAKVVYDVQENYTLNVRYTEAFPALLRPLIALYLRLKEIITTPFIDHYLIAEKVYAQQLPFLGQRYSIIENKALQKKLDPQQRDNFHLVFTGTLSRSTGMFRAVELATRLHAIDENVRLTLIGHVSRHAELAELEDQIRSLQYIELIGGASLVSHGKIIDLIGKAGAGIIAYEMNPATAGRTPTKLYEYYSAGLPIIFIAPEKSWTDLMAASSHPFIAFAASDQADLRLLSWLGDPKSRGTFNTSLSWENEEIELKRAISALS